MPARVRSTAALAITLGLGLGLGACGSSNSSSSPSTSTATGSTPTGTTSAGTTSTAVTLGFEGIPLEQGPDLAPASSTTPGTPVAAIQCGATEQLAYHIHAHLAVYVDGQLRALPAGIGIPGAQVQQTRYGPVVGTGTCFYWLHTHTTDGVIHIESPTQRIYTLGNFFDMWRQPLSANQAGPAKGRITALVDGKPWTKDPRLIPLVPHSVIQLDVGAPVTAFQPVSFSGTQL
jgi:hypothetical protein